ncbi:HNH endonuclease family protein [Streptomyces sp900105245]|uniref:HNH endonuclease family protein n=1 Tax=Streptomyces sp. 900105245 TaxID=3154379 RepID=A0ABV1UKJ5_9ACTN
MRVIYACRILGAVAAATSLLGIVCLLDSPSASAALPTPIGASTARTYLSTLTVAPESRTGYRRELFKTWTTATGTCNTREYVLRRDGSKVQTNPSCAALSGSWNSPYDGATWHNPSDLDIDHLVPLAEAWDSGASTWTNAKREALANDITRPQLIAVTDNVNQSKADQDPAEWLPPRTAYHCTYTRAWVQVKHHYNLSVDRAEKTALTRILSKCS